MTKSCLPGLLLAAALFIAFPVMAADTGAPHGQCQFAENASDLINYHNVGVLRDEVRGRYEHAAEVANSSQALHTRSPLFLWANEAKISCAKVYGSLRKPRQWRKRPDIVMLQKCECFYQRMTRYLGQ